MVGPNAVPIHDVLQPADGGEKKVHFGGEVVPSQRSRSESAFPSSHRCCSERPGAVKGAPLLGAADRALDGADRPKMIAEEGKGGAKGWRNVIRQNGILARRLRQQPTSS